MNRSGPIPIIDCFCGAGGLSIGFEQAGFEVQYAFDFDPAAIATYRHNPKYHHGPSFVRDIRNVDRKSIERDLGRPLGRIVGVIGGPPCQGFSVQRRGSDQDPRNDLVLEYARMIADIRPLFFVPENVVGILSKRGAPYIEKLETELGGKGYSFQVRKLTVSDFGVPQTRTRVILIGQLKESGLPPIPFPEASGEPPKTVRDAIFDLMRKTESDIPNHRADKLSDINLKRIRSIKEGQGRDSLPEELRLHCHSSNSTHRHLDTYGRMSWNEPAPTITAKFDSFSRGRFGHPTLDRTITLREGARLQTFPDDFEFLGGKIEVARQIGNAVPPLFAKQLAECINRTIRSKQ